MISKTFQVTKQDGRDGIVYYRNLTPYELSAIRRGTPFRVKVAGAKLTLNKTIPSREESATRTSLLCINFHDSKLVTWFVADLIPKMEPAGLFVEVLHRPFSKASFVA